MGYSLRDIKYAAIARQIPSDIIFNEITRISIGQADPASGTPSHGYYWYKYNGGTSGLDLTINSVIALGTRKIILLVENADIYLNGNVSLTNGSGFMAILVGEKSDRTKGNIYINQAVTNLEGIYLSDNAFLTGVEISQITGFSLNSFFETKSPATKQNLEIEDK